MLVEIGIRWDDCAFVSWRRVVKFCSGEKVLWISTLARVGELRLGHMVIDIATYC